MGISWDIDTITNPSVQVDHSKAIHEISHEKLHRSEQVRAALYTYRVCFVTKSVGPGTGRTYQQYANELGYSKAYVTRLRRLGRALVTHRIPAESRLFSKLRTEANSKEVAALLDSATPVPHERFNEVLAIHDSSCTRRSATTVSHPHVEVSEALETLRRVLGSTNLQVRLDLEEAVGDLFFELREQRREAERGSSESDEVN